MAVEFDSGLFPLGWITTTPGNPVDFFANYPQLRSQNFTCNQFIIQAGSDNLGRIYIGNQRLNTATGEGLIVVLANPCDIIAFSTIAGNVYRLSDYRMDVETAGDGVLVTVYVR